MEGLVGDNRIERDPMKDHKEPKGRATLNLWPEAGRRLGLGKNATYAAARRGDIPTLRLGNRILVLRAPFERLLHSESVEER